MAKKDDTKVPKGKGRRGELRLAMGDQSSYTVSISHPVHMTLTTHL